jgi:transposase-like protein
VTQTKQPPINPERFSIEFKRQVAQEFLAGETLHGLAKRHDICCNLIRVWVQKYEAGDFDEDAAAAICSSNTNPGSRRWNGLSAGKRWSSSY